MKKSYPASISRRRFLKHSTMWGAISLLPSHVALGNQSTSGKAPSEMINLAVIGIGNQGGVDRARMLHSGHCHVVALCDIDLKGKHTLSSRHIHGVTPIPPEGTDTKERKPVKFLHKARAFTDFRKMFDEMADEIDAVLIATPDHSHFAIAMLAMSLGKHVYVEKPLAHTFGQCSRLMDLAKRSGVVTQMGNQGHSGANYFQFKAWMEGGIIKDVTKITATMNKSRRWHGWGTDVIKYPTNPKPEGIAWDVWAATASVPPFSERLHPAEWRSWYDYGSGAFGDWGPHILDTAHRFLDLGLPQKISAVDLKGTNSYVFPQSSTIRFHFPERSKSLPACEVTWHDGITNIPEFEPEYQDILVNEKTGEPLKFPSPGKVLYSKEHVFFGGSHAEPLRIAPREKMIELRSSLPKFPQKNSSHYENFLLACKGEEEARSPFSISGPLTQVFNLGIIAQRLETDLEFDRDTSQITNHKKAQALLDPAPRQGWEQYYKM